MEMITVTMVSQFQRPLGNKVATLIDENVMPGRHTLSWNAVDDFNRKLPSGIYFYQIQAEGFIDTKKMLLLK